MRLKVLMPRRYQRRGTNSPVGEGRHRSLGTTEADLSTGAKAARGIAVLITAWLAVAPMLWSPSAQAGLGAEPGYVILDLNKGNASGRFVITNTGNKKHTYRARAMHFGLRRNGSIQPKSPDEYSLAQWVKFNPKEFTLPPKSSRVIRYTVVGDKSKLRPHSYWGAIEFMPLKGASFKSKPDKKGRAMEFQVITALLIPIYGNMPGTVYGGRISDVRVERSGQHLGLSAMIENTGGGIIAASGNWQVTAVGTGDVVKKIPVQRFTVFPKETRRLTMPLSEHISKGQYSIKLSLKYHDGKTLSGQGDVKIP